MTGRLGPVLTRLDRLLGGRSLLDAREAVLAPGSAGGDGWTAGQERVDALVDAGADLLVVRGGDSVGALTCTAVLLGLEPLAAVGTDPALVRGDRLAAGWAVVLSEVRDAIPGLRQLAGEAGELARSCGDERVPFLAGALEQAAVRRTPALLDGSSLTAAAALVAERSDSSAAEWWVATQRPPLPAAAAAHDALRLTAVVDLAIGAPGGAGLVLELLRSALRLEDDGG